MHLYDHCSHTLSEMNIHIMHADTSASTVKTVPRDIRKPSAHVYATVHVVYTDTVVDVVFDTRSSI